KELLKEWDVESKGLDIKIFTPSGYYNDYKEKGIPTDFPFSIKPSELSGKDWNMTFSIKSDDARGVLIERVIYDLNEEGTDFDLDDILKKISQDKDFEKSVVNGAKNLFLNAKAWGLFDKFATKLSELAIPGQVSILDVSCYATMPGSWNIKNLVVGLVSEKLFV